MDKKRMINNDKALKLTQNAILIAIVLIMSFTPLGYLKFGVVQISFLSIPVSVGAILLGPMTGGILGFVFGMTSFIQCLMGDPFGAALLGINPVFTFFMCMVPRILMGILVAYIYKAISRVDKTKLVSHIISCLSGSVMNTVFFILTLVMLFGSSQFLKDMMGDQSVLTFIIGMIGIQGVIEAVSAAVLGGAISKSLTIIIEKMGKKKGLA